MGRSKAKRNSINNSESVLALNNSQVVSPKTPSSGRKSQGVKENDLKTTPGHGAVKRPLPSDSDSEQDEGSHSISDLVENGVPKIKKGKFTMSPQDNNLGSADEDTNEETEDSDAEVDDEDDDSVDEDDDDQDEDDDEDDDDEDDDEEDEDDSNEEEDEELKIPPPTQGKKTSAIVTKPVNKPTSTPAEIKQEQRQQDSSDRGFLLIPNAPKDLQKLKNLFSGLGHSVVDVQPLQVPLTLVILSSAASAKAIVSSRKPLSVDGNTVRAMCLDNVENVSCLTHGNATRSVFVNGIPKSVTVELLKSKIPSASRPESVKMLQSGPKNKLFNAAYLNFASTEAATAALNALSQVKFDGQSLRLSYARELSGADNLRGATKCLMVSQLPPSVTEAQLKSIFTTAIGFKLVAKNNESVCYINFPSEAAASEAFDAHKDNSIGKTKLNIRFAPNRDDPSSKFNVDVSGAPANATVADIMAVFPGSSAGSRLANGNFTIQFPSVEVLQAALSGKKIVKGNTLTLAVFGGLRGNVALLKNLPFDASPKELQSIYPNASKIEIHKKPNGQSTGTATVEFSNASACQAAADAQHELKGRRIFVSLKRVDVSAPSKPAADAKKPKQQQEVKKQAPPQVGSASEEESSGEGGSEDEDDDDDEEEESADESEDNDDGEDVVMKPAKGSLQNAKAQKQESEDEDDDEEDDDEEEDDDDEDEDDDEEGSEDGGEEMDDSGDNDEDDEPAVQKKGDFGMKKQHQNFSSDKKSFQRGGRGGGFHRGGGDGFNNRGGGFKRGGGGGGFRGQGNGGGGFRGRGNRGGGGGGFRGRGSGGGGGRGHFRGRGGNDNHRGNRGRKSF